MTQSTTRAEYVAGLRALADLIEQHDHLILPWTGNAYASLQIAPNNRADMQAWVDVLDAVKDERHRSSIVTVEGSVRGLRVSVFARPAKVGTERTETKSVTEFVVDPFTASAVSQ